MTNEERVPTIKVVEDPTPEDDDVFKYVGESDGTPLNPDREIEVMENKALVRIPENTIELELVATLWHDGGAVRVKKTLNTKQVRQAFEDGQDYIDDFDTFRVTDLGLKEMEARNL